MTTWLINLGGLLLMALIVWWFWLSGRGPAKRAGDAPLDIVVDNGVYEPSVIQARAGQPLTLRFLRRDPSPCAEQVIFHELGVSEFLDTGKATTVTLTPERPGEYRFTCQMQMYQGTLIVNE
ncbi:cupredoxin domain-containing protein [Alloalcanivorax xenomutans]|jgi:plastocyanin domain-containing protein|uniref:Cupredoxin domain-containing protein n=1 Tax=Alloalcanivorax xenomutans TaxID=1094342 RepID=A0A9Q3ZHE7_9GAMM|nr:MULTISPECIES: cupredoxin domain-containing protein [Pseudomonadota]ERS10596.1 plastocyanin domain-containing protein [Alcanivorax sp. PN-3]KYZ84639.1 plastocyanin [Alcanivorax sp. KX64203]MBA4720869.1 cupredoxin domain-containing protein [Alcanivorax sp.]ARB44359.1 plastocyanin [Alloalcanivorax xenomutans]MCE7508742.1 cupredoxin domain-containing protein [Alloalcanivorax xenomutans]